MLVLYCKPSFQCIHGLYILGTASVLPVAQASTCAGCINAGNSMCPARAVLNNSVNDLRGCSHDQGPSAWCPGHVRQAVSITACRLTCGYYTYMCTTFC